MDRDVERKAFARARSYLNFHAIAKWTALLAGVGTGLLYVLLLAVLWLFADLIVHRGTIPSFQELTPDRQQLMAHQWDENRSTNVPLLNELLSEIENDPKDKPRLDRLTTADLLQLSTADRELLWRVHLFQLLRAKVGRTAPATVLPTYSELPREERDAFLKWWNGPTDKRGWLVDKLGLPEDLADRLTRNKLTDASTTELHLAWLAYLSRVFLDMSSHDPGYYDTSNALKERLRAEAAQDNPPTDVNTLADHGILSLVVRNYFHSSFFSSLAGWLAMPWMWQPFPYYLTGLLVVALVLVLLRTGLMFLMHEMAARATIAASTRLRRSVYHHTFRMGTLAIRELGPSEAVSIFTRHVEAVHDGQYAWLTVFFREPIKFGLLLAFALVVNFWLALAFLLFAVLVWLVGGQLAGYFRNQGKAAANRATEQLTLIRESLMLMRLVKVYLMELFNQARVERLLARYGALQLRRYRGEAIYKPALVFLGTLAVLVLLYVAGLIVLHDKLGVAGAITLSICLVSLYGPAVAWLENRKFIRRARESSVVLFKFLDRPGEVGQIVGAEFVPPLSKQLEFDNVSLREPGTSRMLLQEVSLTISAGQKVALVGAEDREKLALVYLIPRFLDPTAGEIRIDDHNLRYVTLDSLRTQIAMVMQHNLVFHDTVANNISCGDPTYNLPQIIEAAKVAHAHHFVQKLPQGYETLIGELGHSLSVSEQFRVGLARAILRDPALLIIEEPTITLDEDTKALLDDTFVRVLPGRTVIFLPHRISTIRSADQIFLLHKGKLEATGVHRELLSQNPLYRHLHYIEFNEIAEQV